jgi:AcrR family transcriptional regulator
VSETLEKPNPRRGPHAVRRESTRLKLMEAGVRCLNTVGYAETSTVRVAAEAGVARGSLLHQFPTKVDLILAVASHAALAQGAFIREALGKLAPGRERFMGSIDATWGSLQTPEGRALLQIIVATHHDPDLAAQIADFARRFDEGLSRGARRLADAAGLTTDEGEALEERRFSLATLRGLALEMMMHQSTSSPDAILERLRASRLRFYESHLKAPQT